MDWTWLAYDNASTKKIYNANANGVRSRLLEEDTTELRIPSWRSTVKNYEAGFFRRIGSNKAKEILSARFLHLSYMG